MNLKRILFLLFILFLLVITPAISKEQPHGSTHSATPSGVKAIFLLLKSLNISTSSWQNSFTYLDPDEINSAMIISTPLNFGGEKALINWVKQGNKAIVFLTEDSSNAFKELLSSLKIATSTQPRLATSILKTSPSSKTILTDCHSSLSKCRERITFNSSLSFVPHKKIEVIGRYKEKPVILRQTQGKGEFWIFASSGLISNRFIDQDDNLLLFFDLIRNSNKIYFDEFHHGYTMPNTQEKESRKDALLVLFSIILFTTILAVLSRSVRFGEKVPLTPHLKNTQLEYSSSLGLFAKTNNASTVLQSYIKRWPIRVKAILQHPTKVNNQTDILDKIKSSELLPNSTIQLVTESLEILSTGDGLSNKNITDNIKILESALTHMRETLENKKTKNAAIPTKELFHE